MAKKKITIAADANPFDKSRSAADMMFAPPVPEVDNVDEVSSVVDNIAIVDGVDSVEQQSQQNQYIQQDTVEDEQPKKKGPRQFPGKQHVHLILPDRQADMIKQLAKMSGTSVNQFMSQAIDQMYEEHWKPVVEVLEQNRHKLGFDKKTNKSLFS